MAKGQVKQNDRLLSEYMNENRGLRESLIKNIGDAQTRSSNLFEAILRNMRTSGEASRGGLEEFSRTGGLDPGLRRGMQGDINAYRKFAKTPVSAESKNRIRGGGIFDWLAKTGGFSDLDKLDVMSRAGSANRSIFESLADQIKNQSVASGGWVNPSSSLAKLARQQAYNAADVQRDARIGLSEAVREGRLSGASGMSSAENALLSHELQKFLGGMAGATGAEADLLKLISGNRLAGLEGLNRLDENDVNSLLNLYRSAPGEVAMYQDLLGRNIAQEMQGIGTGIQNQNADRGGFWSTLGKIGKFAAPIAASFIPGVGPLVGAGLAGVLNRGGNRPASEAAYRGELYGPPAPEGY